MKKLWPVVVVVMLLVLWSSVFYVDERELAIKLQFKEIVRADYGPGIHWKASFFEKVTKFVA